MKQLFLLIVLLHSVSVLSSPLRGDRSGAPYGTAVYQVKNNDSNQRAFLGQGLCKPFAKRSLGEV